MEARTNRRRLAVIIGVAAWANANGLTGSSPAGLSVPVHTIEQAEVAAWAVANGLTGPSPSSLRSIDD